MRKLTPEQTLEKAHIQLMRSPEFCLLSGIIMMGESTMEEGIPTAYTDGVNKRYGREFMEGLTEKGRNFTVAHENFHVLLKQITTWYMLWEKDAQCANQAMDYVINLMIRDLDPDGRVVIPPEGVLLDEMFRGWDTRRVFDYLYKEQGGKGGKGGNEGYGGDGRGDSLDNHGWEEAKELTKKEVKELGEAIDEAIRQGSILAGKMAGNAARELAGELTRPTVDWRALMQEFMTSFCAGRDSATWRRPNRRWLAQDIYLPSPIAESIGPVVVAIDGSGSIVPAVIGMFLSHVRLMTETVTPEKVYIVYWDTRTYEPEVYEPSQYDLIPTSTKPQGGGGTDPTCVKEWLDNTSGLTPSVVLVLTDGYVFGDFPEFGVPTLWGITSDVVATTGTTVRIET